jgi:hypothetical protein
VLDDGKQELGMGRDLLAQDYLLKQLTASLVYPEKDLGKKFWDRIYKKAKEKYGDVEIPMSTFNKVWIMPEHAKIFEFGTTAVITESHLKVMLEQDYLAFLKSFSKAPDEVVAIETNKESSFGAEIVREIVLPEIEKEVNEGENFSKLRQIYRSMIMASWYKRKLKDGLLGKMYVGANKVSGVEVQDKQIKQKIYDQYLAAFKKGVYNYIREDIDIKTQEVIPRKYFSGGFVAGAEVDRTTEIVPVDQRTQAAATSDAVGSILTAAVGLNPINNDQAGGANANEDVQTPEVPNGGALKQIGVLGDEQAVGVTAQTLKRWAQLAQSSSSQGISIKSQQIAAKIIYSETSDADNGRMPDGVLAYHFRNEQGELIIVLSNNLGQDELNEAIYHEFREDYWEMTLRQELEKRLGVQAFSTRDLADIQWKSHVLASAEQSISFGEDQNAITKYHARQISGMQIQQLQALIQEDRQLHQKVISAYVNRDQFEKYQRYEEKMRQELISLLSARRSGRRIDIDVPVFKGLTTAALNNRETRPSLLTEIRRTTIEKIQEAYRSAGETEGALGYELGRLTGAAFDSIINRFDNLAGDAIKQDAFVREAKVSFSYTMEPKYGNIKATLTDNGAGISRDLLDGLTGKNIANKQIDRTGMDVYLMVQNLIGGAMAYNLWDEIYIISRVRPEQFAYRYTSGKSGQASVNDFYTSIETGTSITFTGRSLGWSSRRFLKTAPAQTEPAVSSGNVNAQQATATEQNPAQDEVGGIDMNANALNLQMEGKSIQFDMPFDPAQWKNIKFDGFTPVILQINTINLPLFIGAQETDKTIQLSSI